MQRENPVLLQDDVNPRAEPGILDHRLAALAREKNVHHARPGASREEALDRRSHDFGFGFAWFVGGDESPKTVKDDVHGLANFHEFFLALDSASHVELRIEGNEFKRRL